jgi:hypothetical protein
VSRLLDRLSEFLAHRRGLLPLVGLLLVIANFILQLVQPGAWLSSTNLLLHLGIVTAIFGLMLARAL